MRTLALAGGLIGFAVPTVLVFVGLYSLCDPARRSTLRWAGRTALTLSALFLLTAPWR